MGKLLVHIRELDDEKFKVALDYLNHYLAAEKVAAAGSVVLLANGASVLFFRKGVPFAEAIAAAMNGGATFELCAHALAGHRLEAADLIKGCEIVPWGIVELVERQNHGFAYVRP